MVVNNFRITLEVSLPAPEIGELVHTLIPVAVRPRRRGAALADVGTWSLQR